MNFFFQKGVPGNQKTVETLVNFLPVSSLTFLNSGKVMSMLFWGNVYGVGNAKSSPVSAVLTDIFMTTVDCVVGLVAGWGSESLILGSSDEWGKTIQKLKVLLGWSSSSTHPAYGIIQHSNQMFLETLDESWIGVVLGCFG